MAINNFFRRRLQVKMISIIAAILLLGFGVLVILNIERESTAMIAQNRKTSDLLASAIVESIANGMLEARPDIIRLLVQELKTTLTDIKQLDVFRLNGVEAFSDLSTFEEVDLIYDLDPFVRERIVKMQRNPGQTLKNPLFTQAVETLQPQAYIEQVDGTRFYTSFYPLKNREACYECHGDDRAGRGIVRLSLSLEQLDKELQDNRNKQIGMAFLTIVIAMGCLVLLMRKVVLNPIRNVVETTQRVGQGEFTAKVAIRSQDEIGQLGTSINDMTDRLEGAYNDLAAKNSELNDALQHLQESIQKVELLEQIKGELVKFVPESVTQLLEKNPNAQELEKQEKDVSVLFLDIEGYTRLAEQLELLQLNQLIQDYFSRFLEVIRANHGDINETAGDGLMVIFHGENDAVEHPLNAAHAALQLQNSLTHLNQEFAGSYPPVAIHIGINSGTALVGATKLDAAGGGRWTFTASGSTTNLAARIASLTQGGEIMVGPATAERIKSQFVLEDTGPHELKNVSEPVQVFRLIPPGVYTHITA